MEHPSPILPTCKWCSRSIAFCRAEDACPDRRAWQQDNTDRIRRMLEVQPALITLLREIIEHDVTGERLIRARRLLADIDRRKPPDA